MGASSRGEGLRNLELLQGPQISVLSLYRELFIPGWASMLAANDKALAS